MKFRGRAVSLPVMGAVLAISMCGTVAYGAETFGFEGVTGSTTDMALGERQFFVDVIPAGTRETTFRFTNIGTTPSSIVGITFDDRGFGDDELGPVLLKLDDTTTRGAGVSFMTPAVSPEFPGAETLFPFLVVRREFVLTSNMPVASNGINPGESLTVRATLQSTGENDEVLERLGSGQLRIGLTAEGFADERTASFINGRIPTVPPNVVPEVIPCPAAVLLGSLGVGLLGMLRRRGML